MGFRTYLGVAAAVVLLGGAFAACNTAGSGGALTCTDGGTCPSGTTCSSNGLCVASEAGSTGGTGGMPGTGGTSGSGTGGTGGTGGSGTGGSGTGGSGTGGSGTGGSGGSGGTGGSGTGGGGGTGGGSYSLPAGCLTNPSQWQLDCNPLTNAGCNTAAGEACDGSTTGWTCYTSGNTQQLGQSCDLNGPYCVGTLLCYAPQPDGGQNTAGTCKRYCCSDSDCNGGTCVPLDAANLGTIGYCN